MKNGINGKSLREKLLYLNKNLGTFDKSHICFEAFLNNEEVIKVFDNIENKDFSEEHLKGILNNFYYLYEGIYFNLHRSAQSILKFIMCSYLYDENQIKEFIYKDSDEIKYDIEDYFQSIDINWGRCLFLLREFYLIKVDGYSYVNNKRHLYIPSTELPVLQKIIYRLPIKALTNIYEIFYKHSYSYKKVVKDDNLMKKIDEIGEGLKKVPHIMIERRIINERNGLKRYEKWYKG